MRARLLPSIGTALGFGLGLLLGSAFAAADAPGAPRLLLELERPQGTVGDLLPLRIVIDLPAATRLEPEPLGPSLGPFALVDGAWSGPEPADGGTRWTFRGSIVSYRTGDLELPEVRVRITAADGSSTTVASEPRRITIESVLESGAEQGELSDLKAPAEIAPRYGALVGALGVLLLLLGASAVLWWLHRRYAARLAAVPAPDDPFHRTPPHVWVYAELQRLLAERLAEAGDFARFYAELARIVKLYLSGRFRIELMERTTDEVSRSLEQAGAGAAAIRATVELLQQCDMVKFAKEPARSADCRAAIEQAYRIVDETKPESSPESTLEQGAA